MTEPPSTRSTCSIRRAYPWILLTAAVVWGCSDPSGPGSLATERDRIVVAFHTDTSGYPDDDWELLEGGVDGDTLQLRVRYGGGCRTHRFWLLAVDDWIPLPDFGPIPTVGVSLRLSHDAAGDPCDALVAEGLRFGLEPLRAAYRERYGTGPARLLLQITDGRDGLAIVVFDWFLGSDATGS